MLYLKQSTAATIHVGPAVDATDGFTPETGLAAGTVDEIGVYKHAGTSLTSISGTTTLTHRAGGMYTATLSTSDTDTVGHLVFYMRDDSVCRPIRLEFTVLPANVYDSLVGGTDQLDVNTAQWAGTTVTLSSVSAKPEMDVYSISNDATAANNLESYCDGGSNMPVDAVKISGDGGAADNCELFFDGTGYNASNSTIGTVTTAGALGAQAKLDVNAEVDTALNTAIPGSPTANSINQRIKAIDELTESGGAGDLAAILLDTGTDGVQVSMAQSYPVSPTNGTVGDALATARSIRNNYSVSGTTLTVKKDDGSTTFYTKTLDSATNPTSLS